MSKIEWTEKTWNPIAGCSRVSEGCRNCYAETMAKRLAAMGQEKYKGLVDEKGHWTGKISFDEKALLEPLKRKKPTTYFVNSMSDLFHENVPEEWIDKIFAVMLACHLFDKGHTFQILTKRQERMFSYFDGDTTLLLQRWGKAGDHFIDLDNPDMLFSELLYGTCTALWDKKGRASTQWSPWSHPENCFPLPNVWLGVSVEDQQAADERIPLLLETPAAIRFLSIEPLLGEVDLTPFSAHPLVPESIPLDWVIVGGESGHGVRPMHPAWVASLRDQCVSAGVPFFFKQWGQWKLGSTAYGKNYLVLKNGDYFPLLRELVVAKAHDLGGDHAWHDQQPEVIHKSNKSQSGRELDGRTWDEYPVRDREEVMA